MESGREQAAALRVHLAWKGVRFEQVLVSPLLRTRETAALIAPDVPAEPTEWLREIDHGPDEGRTEVEVVTRIGAAALEHWEAEAVPPDGWVVDAETRLAGWRGFLDALPPGDTLLVTSNGAARYLRLALGLFPAKLRTGAYAQVDARGLVAWDIRP